MWRVTACASFGPSSGGEPDKSETIEALMDTKTSMFIGNPASLTAALTWR